MSKTFKYSNDVMLSKIMEEELKFADAFVQKILLRHKGKSRKEQLKIIKDIRDKNFISDKAAFRKYHYAYLILHRMIQIKNEKIILEEELF